jgi:EAL domain-containing protein (putative c-di-GMP-specific phosphodiesterase class I)
VKIDGSFVEAVCRDAHAAAVVRSIVALAGVLGMDAVAERVETTGERDRLVSLGCSLGQGFLFGRPMSPSSLAGRLARRHPLLRH